jgi:hypothetical protein
MPSCFDVSCLKIKDLIFISFGLGNFGLETKREEEIDMTLMNETLNSTAPNLASDAIFFDKKREFLQEKIKILNKLCHEIDPYKEITENHQMILAEFGISNFSDPFEVTNRLVVALEDSIEEFQALEIKLKETKQKTVQ